MRARDTLLYTHARAPSFGKEEARKNGLGGVFGSRAELLGGRDHLVRELDRVGLGDERVDRDVQGEARSSKHQGARMDPSLDTILVEGALEVEHH